MKRTHVAIAAAVVLLLVVAVVGALEHWARRPLPEGLIQANGRIEGDHVTVASKFLARVERLAVREGDSVERGQALVLLADAQVDARIEQAGAALAQSVERVRAATAALQEADAGLAQAHTALTQARARAAEARQTVGVVEARIRAARTALALLRDEVDVAIAGAEAGLAEARARRVRAGASESQASRDADRLRRLAEDGLVAPQQSEQADLAWATARSEVSVAESAEVQAAQRLGDARLGPQRIAAREDEIATLEAERRRALTAVTEAEAAAEQALLVVTQAEATVTRARAGLGQATGAREQARAALAEAESVRQDLTLPAPTAGVVMTRMVDVGEVVAAGAPLLELVDLDRLYLKVFVAETVIGKLRLGLPAMIHTDAFPDRPFPATVRYIASRAEFTPKEVQTPSERVKLVYAVRLYLAANPEHRLTPGLPADAVIRWKPDVAWQKPRW